MAKKQQQQLPPTQKPEAYFLEIVIVSSILTFIALLLAAGRVYVRLRILRSFGWDDWLIVGSAVGVIAGMVVTAFGAKVIQSLAELILRLLKEAEEINRTQDREAAFRFQTTVHPEVGNYETTMQAQIVAFTVSLTLARLSILLSYRRFTPREVSPVLRQLTLWFCALTVLIGIASIVIVITPCWPPHLFNFNEIYASKINEMFFGGKPFPFKCLGQYTVIILGLNLGLAPDLVIFAMPFFMLQKANIRRNQRRNLYILFAFGGLVFCAAVTRLGLVLFVAIDGTASFPMDVAGWCMSVLEATGMVATACIPTLNPLYRMFTGSRPLNSVDEPRTRTTTAPPEKKKVDVMVMMEEARGPQPSRPPRSPMFNDESELRGGGRPGVNATTQSFGLGLGAGLGYGPTYDDKLNLQVVNPDRSRSATPASSSRTMSPGPNNMLFNIPNSLPGSNPRPRAGTVSSQSSQSRLLPNNKPLPNLNKSVPSLPPTPRANVSPSHYTGGSHNRSKSTGSLRSLGTNPGGIMGGGVGFLAPMPPSSTTPILPPLPSPHIIEPSLLNPDVSENRLSAVSTSASAIIDAYAERNNTPTPPSPIEFAPPPPPEKPKLMIPEPRQQQYPPRAPTSGLKGNGYNSYESPNSSASPSGYTAYTPSTPGSGILSRGKSTSRQSRITQAHDRTQSQSSFTLPNGGPTSEKRMTANSFFENLKRKAGSPTPSEREINTYGNGTDAYGRGIIVNNDILDNPQTQAGAIPASLQAGVPASSTVGNNWNAGKALFGGLGGIQAGLNGLVANAQAGLGYGASSSNANGNAYPSGNNINMTNLNSGNNISQSNEAAGHNANNQARFPYLNAVIQKSGWI